jgi:hypothetical protein
MVKVGSKKPAKKVSLKKATVKDLNVAKSKSKDVKGGVGGAATFSCGPTQCYC